MNVKVAATLAVVMGLFSGSVSAGLISDGTWDGWTVFADDDGIVGPGGGGHTFDAQYLLYKVEGTTVSLGLQTGFDVVAGYQQHTDGRSYWAGDMALSFDGAVLGDADSYEYAIDFGLGQCGWSQGLNHDCGQNNEQNLNAAAGLYQVAAWNNDVYSGHTSSNPFAMSSAQAFFALLTNSAGSVGKNFYRQISFDLNDLGVGSVDQLDLHWTMSCGNDAIDGHFTDVPDPDIPVPGSAPLLGLGLIGLLAGRRRGHQSRS